MIVLCGTFSDHIFFIFSAINNQCLSVLRGLEAFKIDKIYLTMQIQMTKRLPLLIATFQ